MNPDAVQALFNYTYWAFDRVWLCIDAISDDQFVQPLNYSMGSIRNHVVHLMSGTRRWIERVEQRNTSPHLEFEDFTSKQQTRQQWDHFQRETLGFVNSLQQEQLNAIIEWTIPTRQIKKSTPVWAIMLHVANHATDHRAQILAMLHHHFGVETVEQDMIFYFAERGG